MSDLAIATYRERLLDEARMALPEQDVAIIEAAADFAIVAHRGQRRLSGAPYVTHPLETGRKLAAMHLPRDVVVAGVLHDVHEDANVSLEDIARHFNPDVAKLVAGVTKVGKVQLRGEQRYIENLRKMFVALADDVRVMFIKFADRMHNLEDLDVVPDPKRTRIAREALEIYAPIANRLGMHEMKAQLEDLAFPYLNPNEAAWVEALLVATYSSRKRDVYAMLKPQVAEKLAQQNIAVHTIEGRMKHRYSLYQKLLRNNRDITKIYDHIALRIIVGSVADCYAVLGVLHQHWKPVKGRIKDYIANPKANGYQSLHTTIVVDTPEGTEVVEFQIRTIAMHEEAEWGAAAAWRYHEHDPHRVPERQLQWVNDLVQWQRTLKDPSDFIAGLKSEVLRDRILVFTPHGDVIDLPEGATPLDFAYAIHTDVGNHAVGVRVNGSVALCPLDTPLENGDLVEILIDPKRKGPSPDWIEIVRTTHARAKIREALRSGVRATLHSWALAAKPKRTKSGT